MDWSAIIRILEENREKPPVEICEHVGFDASKFTIEL
jgi:hypothetical protein